MELIPCRRRKDNLNESLQAVVFSGSGCSSVDAYAVGVMAALLEGPRFLNGEPFEPSIFSGSAFGAWNAAIMTSEAAQGTAAAVSYLRKAWLEGLCSSGGRPNGVYRVRCDPRRFLDPRDLFEPDGLIANPLRAFTGLWRDVEYLAKDLAERIEINFAPAGDAGLVQRVGSLFGLTPWFDMSPLRQCLHRYVDLSKLRGSAKALMVNATDWVYGISRVFTNVEMTDAQGYDILQASAAYMALFPFVEIQGQLYAGGPASLATPIRPVVEEWAPKTDRLTVHTVRLNPPVADIPREMMTSAWGGFARYFDINEAINTQAGLEFSADWTPGGTSQGGGPVTIHNYRPSRAIANWYEMLEFDPSKTEGFMDLGYRDAKSHDCRTAGCAIAKSQQTAVAISNR